MPPPPRLSNAAVIATLVVLGLLVGGYVIAAVVTRDRWMGGGAPSDLVRVQFSAQPPAGVAPDPGELAEVGTVLKGRVAALGGTNVEVSTGGDGITVTATGVDAADVGKLGTQGQLYLRPVIHSIPSQAAGIPSPPGSPAPGETTTPTPRAADDKQRVADEKALRQSDDQSIQMLALQFQATRCPDDDPLAGLDDPDLPLVTCSSDDENVYLLGPSIIDNTGIAEASAGHDEQNDQTVVDVEFTSEAAKTWASFTKAHIGSQVAFAVDTEVVSAPAIMEQITGGRTQITGQFSKAEAEDLASVLARGSLPFPLSVESSSTEPGPPPESPLPWRIGVIAGGVAVVLATVGALVFLAARRRVR